ASATGSTICAPRESLWCRKIAARHDDARPRVTCATGRHSPCPAPCRVSWAHPGRAPGPCPRVASPRSRPLAAGVGTGALIDDFAVEDGGVDRQIGRGLRRGANDVATKDDDIGQLAG